MWIFVTADSFIQEAEADVYRLESLQFRAGDIVHKAAAGRRARRRQQFEPLRKPARINTGKKSCRDRFDIPFDTADLSCKKHLRLLSCLERREEKPRRMDIGIPMNLSEAQ